METAAQRVYDELIQSVDDAFGDLNTFVGAIGDILLQDLEDIVRDGPNNEAGWSVIVDPTRVVDDGLDYVGQFVGISFAGAIDPIIKRALIEGRTGWDRGTPAAMIAAAQTTLIGNKTVTLIERNGDPYTLTVVTKPAETPDPDATLSALLSQKPGGITLLYQNIVGQTYADLLTNAGTYQLAFTTYSTYLNLLLNNSVAVGSRTFGSGTFGSGTFGGN